MTAKKGNDNYQVVWLVRRLFRAMARKAGENLEQYGLTAADRAVMEFLFPEEELSVPEIASRYQVSRQHVQVTVNRLAGMGLLTSKANPRHKRSKLMALTARGRRTFSTILEGDRETVERLFSGIPAVERAATRRTLETLLSKLSERG